MPRFPTLDSKWLTRWTRRLAAAAFVTMAAPFVVVLFMISFVGLPLAIVLMATPTLFCIVGLAALVRRLHGRDGAAAVVLSLAASLAVLALAAQAANLVLDRRAEGFVTGDHDTLERPVDARRIALIGITPLPGNRGLSRCHDACQRLLLSGAAERVLVADLAKPGDAWGPATAALSYRMEGRAACPVVHLPDSLPGRLANESVDSAETSEALRLAIAGGRCLVEEAATLGDADVVVVAGRLQRGRSDFDAGLSLLADTVTVDRASVHRRRGDAFVEEYRWTGVRVLRHPPIPVPSLVGGSELRMEPGFLRNARRLGERAFAPDGVDLVLFLRDGLGLDVSVPAASATAPAVVQAGLDRPGPVDAALRQVIEDLFDQFLQRGKADEAVEAAALRALADPRVPAPRYAYGLVRAMSGAGDAANARLADLLFRKLAATDPEQREDHPTYLGYPAAYLATAIAALPRSAVLAHRGDLEALARDPARRRRAREALTQLPAFGADAVPTLLLLVDEACRLRADPGDHSRDRNREDWQDLLYTALAGLCELGPVAASATAPLQAKLADGCLPGQGATKGMALAALVRMGVAPSTLRSPFGADTTPDDAKRFERDVARARERGDCRGY